jgi:recombination associated protein RdgC
MKNVSFKNICIYRISRDFRLPAAELQEQLSKMAFTPCGSQDMAKTGWVPTIGDSFVLQYGDHFMLTEKHEEKILPSPVLKAELDKKVEILQLQQGRKLKKTEKDSLKDEVLHSLLPRAFTRVKMSRMWIDAKEGLVFVEAASAKKAENMLALLRKTLGSFPVVPFTPASPVELTVTEWLRSGFPKGFTAGDEAAFKALLEDGGAVRAVKQDLQSDEMMAHVDAGKVAVSIGLHWSDRASFRLSDDLTIKKLTFCDELCDQNDDVDREDPDQRLTADFILFTSEFSALFTQLVEAIGGECDR